MVVRPKSAQSALPVRGIPYAQCIGKTFAAGDARLLGRTVYAHCCIVGSVAQKLCALLPAWLTDDMLVAGCPLLAAVHDVGKVYPTFQGRIYAHDMSQCPVCRADLPILEEKAWGGHAGVSQATLDALLGDSYLPEIVGQHHGSVCILQRLATDYCFGGKPWQAEREALLAALQKIFPGPWPKITSQAQARVVAGLICVADWIGSGEVFDDPHEPWTPLIEEAVHGAGFVPVDVLPDLEFSDIFPFSAHHAQNVFVEHCQGSGVYILEAPMGMGKTEAALYAAYRVLAAGKATGLYFALPTRLTSGAIHGRVNEFLHKILAPDSPHSTALLLHGKAWLQQTAMGEEGRPTGSWFQSRKRALLAPFAVGTLDQALMAVMNVRHGAVRAFGLAGKVVILDEVHSYDAYTGTLLDALVKALRVWKCTVIILSATLTQHRREQFMCGKSAAQAYPLVSLTRCEGHVEEYALPAPESESFTLRLCTDSLCCHEEALSRAEQGQQVLWIENTVRQAQDAFTILAARGAELGIECGLLHAHFTQHDRTHNEGYWVQCLGKQGHAQRKEHGRILVGTQVVEQSLDIDADFLVSNICPMDMVLQRMGRLWRHKNSPRPDPARREIWLRVPVWECAQQHPLEAFEATGKVYSPYVLCRTYELLRDRPVIALPYDIRPLLEATYADRTEQGPLACAKNEIMAHKDKLARLALSGLAQSGRTQADTSPPTRYGDVPYVSVVLLRQVHEKVEGREVRFVDGTRMIVPARHSPLTPSRRRELAASFAEQTLSVPEYNAPRAMTVQQLDWLRDVLYLDVAPNDPQKKAAVRVALCAKSGLLSSLDASPAADRMTLSYDSRRGYHVHKGEI